MSEQIFTRTKYLEIPFSLPWKEKIVPLEKKKMSYLKKKLRKEKNAIAIV